MRFIPYKLNEGKLTKIQLAGLKWTVAHAYKHTAFYKEQFDKAGLQPEDIRTLDDIQHLPFTEKEDLQKEYPFPLRAVPYKDIVRIHASSGTTGKRKILCYTQKDIDVWADIFARCYELAGLTLEDRVQIAVGYGLWTAGVGFQGGCERFGAMAVPVGPANADMHCEMMVDMETTVFCSTASMALLIAEEINKRNLKPKIKVKTIILGAERHSHAMRSRIKELMGVEHIFDIYGLTELYGPGTGLDCRQHAGIHYWADHFIFEIVDPKTLQVVSAGQQGELVVTTLNKEGSPLIRYRTHDISSLIPSPCLCGVPLPMHDRILGRTDDMFTYRAVNIYPSQIDHVLGLVDGVGSEYQIHLKEREGGRDMMIVKAERAMGKNALDDDRLAERVVTEIRRKILVRSQVEIVDHGSLPRTQRKSQRVFEHRNSV
ncbi:MAG: phenylacetate--CoA ligase [Desulfobacterales bacterium]|nr:MAG: phenylacetate--CoA ligase [Desulfobacterales bacterium]